MLFTSVLRFLPFLIWTGFLRWSSDNHHTFVMISILQSLPFWMSPLPPLSHLYSHRIAWHHWAQCHHRHPRSLAHGGAGNRQPSCRLDKTHCPPNYPSCYQHVASAQSKKSCPQGLYKVLLDTSWGLDGKGLMFKDDDTTDVKETTMITDNIIHSYSYMRYWMSYKIKFSKIRVKR